MTVNMRRLNRAVARTQGPSSPELKAIQVAQALASWRLNCLVAEGASNEAVGAAYLAWLEAGKGRREAETRASEAHRAALKAVKQAQEARKEELAALGEDAPQAWTHSELGRALRTPAYERVLGPSPEREIAEAELARRRAIQNALWQERRKRAAMIAPPTMVVNRA